MIYLTGDVHTKLPGHWEQRIAGKEINAAINYLEILKKYKVSSTLFLNGKCLNEDKEKVKELQEYNVELGGHTYDNFGSMGPIKSYIYRKIWGCIYGPSSYQRKDIRKTKNSFEKQGIKITSWRTHSYGSNENTYKILNEEGINFLSDIVGEIKPFSKENIIHLPINIPTDVNTIAYGELKPESKNPFASCTKGRISPEEWFEIIKKRISYNEKNNIDSILLIHPITMAVLDNFKLFEEIAKFFSKYKTKKISEFILR
jgi:peptidoglycan/xylan/chitin deacetylase (PgdA/CDA1 family)